MNKANPAEVTRSQHALLPWENGVWGWLHWGVSLRHCSPAGQPPAEVSYLSFSDTCKRDRVSVCVCERASGEHTLSSPGGFFETELDTTEFVRHLAPGYLDLICCAHSLMGRTFCSLWKASTVLSEWSFFFLFIEFFFIIFLFVWAKPETVWPNSIVREGRPVGERTGSQCGGTEASLRRRPSSSNPTTTQADVGVNRGQTNTTINQLSI